VYLVNSDETVYYLQAALCAIRIVRKVPETIENFLPRVKSLLTERNHGVLLTAVTLMSELCTIDANNIGILRPVNTKLIFIQMTVEFTSM
jgi:AP-1 complex subunit gamma-1